MPEKANSELDGQAAGRAKTGRQTEKLAFAIALFLFAAWICFLAWLAFLAS